MLQSHGFPRIMGVLTHLDSSKFKSRNGGEKKLRAVKKQLKHRFWTEIYQGAKLFYLSGLINGKYPKSEILNLSRFISVMKFRPLVWRNTHSYLIADRMEDLTSEEELRSTSRKCDRVITMYGYVRGTKMKSGVRVHLPGVGDLSVSSVTALPDPCINPSTQSEKKIKARLDDRQRLLYAPMSDVGGILYDKDAVYISVPGIFSKSSVVDAQSSEAHQISVEERTQGEKMVLELQNLDETFGHALNESKIQLFTRSQPVQSHEVALNGDGDRSNESSTEESEQASGTDESDSDLESAVSDEEVETDSRTIRPSVESECVVEENGRVRRRALRPTLIPGSGQQLEDGSFDAQQNRAVVGLIDSDDEEEVVKYADSDDDLGELSDVDLNDDGEDDNIDGEDDEDCDFVDSVATSKSVTFSTETATKWKENLARKAHDRFSTPKELDLMGIVYGGGEVDVSANTADTKLQHDSTESHELFNLISKSSSAAFQHPRQQQFGDFSKPSITDDILAPWGNEETLQALASKFITGKQPLLAADARNDAEVYGDFEDLETGESHARHNEDGGAATAPELESSDDGGSDDDSSSIDESKKQANAEESMRLKREALKQKFDAEYDNAGDGDASNNQQSIFDAAKEAEKLQKSKNHAEFENDDPEIRALIEGHPSGTYVRILLRSVPAEFVDCFDPHYPMLLGSLPSAEENFGFVQTRIKKHRWHKKILKTNDPLIFSLGWRRFQSIPVYSLSDGTRNRMLKYTPEHMHCLATFFGPLTPPNTGFCCFQSVGQASVF